MAPKRKTAPKAEPSEEPNQPDKVHRIGAGDDDETKLAVEDNSAVLADLKAKFLVAFNDDVVSFFKWLQSVNPADPCNALSDVLGIVFTGPFDVLAGRFKDMPPKTAFCVYWRHWSDPPEACTVAKACKRDSPLHWIVWHDDPTTAPVGVAVSDDTAGQEFKWKGATLFEAVETELGARKRKKNVNAAAIDALLASCRAAHAGLPKLPAPTTKSRLGAPLHGLGISVPVNEEGVGYRECPLDASEFVSMGESLAAGNKGVVDRLYTEVIGMVNLANDECDPGMGLECGHNMWSAHLSLQPFAVDMLSMAYSLLHRPILADILQQHAMHRTDPE